MGNAKNYSDKEMLDELVVNYSDLQLTSRYSNYSRQILNADAIPFKINNDEIK